MQRTLLVGLLGCLLGLGLTACDDDEVTEIVSYDFTIINDDDVEYQVWVDAAVDDEEFVQDGVVAANGTRVLRDRTIAVRYDIRLVTPGQNPNIPDEDFVYQTVITSNGPDITWTVPPPPTP